MPMRRGRRGLSVVTVCAFAGVGQEDVAQAIAHYDFREISLCEFFLAELAWYGYPHGQPE